MSGNQTKGCPECGARVLTAARVCKHCRHRFVEGTAETLASRPGTLARPSASRIGGGAPAGGWQTILIAGLGLLVIVIVGVALVDLLISSDADEPSAGVGESELITEAELEQELESNLAAQSGEGIAGISCSGGGSAGDEVGCDVRFVGGDEQAILVAVEENDGEAALEISLP